MRYIKQHQNSVYIVVAIMLVWKHVDRPSGLSCRHQYTYITSSTKWQHCGWVRRQRTRWSTTQREGHTFIYIRADGLFGLPSVCPL